MPLGRKVDDVARIGERTRIVGEQPSGPNLAFFARGDIGVEIGRERLLELQARPRPMTPTQLTGLTSASASTLKMSPVMSSTAAITLLTWSCRARIGATGCTRCPDFQFTPQSQVIENERPIFGWFTAKTAEICQRRKLGKLLLCH